MTGEFSGLGRLTWFFTASYLHVFVFISTLLSDIRAHDVVLIKQTNWTLKEKLHVSGSIQSNKVFLFCLCFVQSQTLMYEMFTISTFWTMTVLPQEALYGSYCKASFLMCFLFSWRAAQLFFLQPLRYVELLLFVLDPLSLSFFDLCLWLIVLNRASLIKAWKKKKTQKKNKHRTFSCSVQILLLPGLMTEDLFWVWCLWLLVIPNLATSAWCWGFRYLPIVTSQTVIQHV